MHRILGFLTVLLPLFVYLVTEASAAAQAQSVIWEIGKFDQSSAEFNALANLSDPSHNPTFIVGQSNPAKDWPASQPGSENQVFGGRVHPYTVIFNLPNTPKGAYRLTVSTLLYNSRVPQLLVEVNGKSGLFYLNRKLSYYAGDLWIVSPIYGGDQLEVTLPSAALRAGENKLILTALDDPKDGSGESILTYDALRLTQEGDERPAALPQVTVEPTVLYTEREKQLLEQTFVTVTFGERVHSGDLTLTVGRDKFQAKLSDTRDFGQQRFEFAIPELGGKTAGLVSLSVNGKRQNFPVMLEPKRKWTLYVVPHVHLDVGFTDYQAKATEVHSRNIDKLLEEIKTHPEMRFSLDGSLVVREYLATRNAAAREKFLQLARERKIAVPAQYASLLTGYATLEELIRSALYSYRLHREHGIPFDYANITDIPNYSWSYASILSALGVKYFAAASNNDHAPILAYGRWNEKSPFWWQGPDGNKILMSYSRHYAQLSTICGLPRQVTTCRQTLPTFLQAYESPSYKPDAVLIYGSQGDNADLLPNEAAILESWNSQYAYPKMVFATFPDYFRYIEQHFASSLDTVVGDGGPYWEDAIGTDAWYGVINRSNQQRALSAEKLSTVASFVQKNVARPGEQIERMWSDLILYAEHTWTSWGGYFRPDSEQSVRQLATKGHRVIDGRETVNAIVQQSLSQLADQIHMPAPGLVVFNPLNWTRSALVETDIDANMVVVEYPDMSPVPVEIVRQERGNAVVPAAFTPLHLTDYDRVRFLAKDVPPLGYKCYQVVSPPGRPPAPLSETALANVSAIENSYYRVEVDPATGAVRSLFDKELKRELVDVASPYRLNQYLYVAGGDETATQILYFQKSLPLAHLNRQPFRRRSRHRDAENPVWSGSQGADDWLACPFD